MEIEICVTVRTIGPDGNLKIEQAVVSEEAQQFLEEPEPHQGDGAENELAAEVNGDVDKVFT